jgi:hypothetical protein
MSVVHSVLENKYISDLNLLSIPAGAAKLLDNRPVIQE